MVVNVGSFVSKGAHHWRRFVRFTTTDIELNRFFSQNPWDGAFFRPHTWPRKSGTHVRKRGVCTPRVEGSPFLPFTARREEVEPLRVLRSRKKLSVAIVAVAAAGAFAAVAFGTTPIKFGGPPLVTATLNDSVQLNSDRVKFQTKDPTFVRVAKITIDADGNSGWHHHPGIVIVAVLSGTVKFTNSDCSSTTHAAGTAFVEGGDGPGLAESVGGQAIVYATFIVPQTPVPPLPSNNFRIDDPAPACAG